MKRLKIILYWLIHITWGFPTFLYGSLITLYMLLTMHKPHIFGFGVYFVSKKLYNCGFEAGPFFVISKDCENSLPLKQHEHGHGLQTLWWGPLTLFVITIPSMIRFNYRRIKHKTYPPYDSIWFEGQATKLGKKYFLEG